MPMILWFWSGRRQKNLAAKACVSRNCDTNARINSYLTQPLMT